MQEVRDICTAGISQQQFLDNRSLLDYRPIFSRVERVA